MASRVGAHHSHLRDKGELSDWDGNSRGEARGTERAARQRISQRKSNTCLIKT